MRISGVGWGALQQDAGGAGIDEILAGLGRMRGYGGFLTAAAVAAQSSMAQFRNPSGSGKVAYFLLGDLWVATAMSVNVAVDTSDLGAGSAATPLFTGGPAGAVTIKTGAAAAPGGTTFIQTPSLAINTAYLLPSWFWYALPGNHNLTLWGGTVNQAFTCNIRWIELSA